MAKDIGVLQFAKQSHEWFVNRLMYGAAITSTKNKVSCTNVGLYMSLVEYTTHSCITIAIACVFFIVLMVTVKIWPKQRNQYRNIMGDISDEKSGPDLIPKTQTNNEDFINNQEKAYDLIKHNERMQMILDQKLLDINAIKDKNGCIDPRVLDYYEKYVEENPRRKEQGKGDNVVDGVDIDSIRNAVAERGRYLHDIKNSIARFVIDNYELKQQYLKINQDTSQMWLHLKEAERKISTMKLNQTEERSLQGDFDDNSDTASNQSHNSGDLIQ